MTILEMKRNKFPMSSKNSSTTVGKLSHPVRQISFTPLKIELTSNAKPVPVRLRNYSLQQRKFLQNLMKVLSTCFP